MLEQIHKEDYDQMVLQKVEENHIWLNKMTYYIRPTDEEKIALANMILDKLRAKSTQIPASGITSETEVIREIAELTPMLYLSINWS